MKDDQSLVKMRHSFAHLLGAAVLKLYPDTHLAIGPAIDNGFYYDFEFSSPLSDTELSRLEKTMAEILKTWKEFSHKEVSGEEVLEVFKNNPYKSELIADIVSRKEPITLYTVGDFTDLCRGGHVEDTKELHKSAFKLTRLAGAYWKGDEKNKMLTRIYGLAFPTKKELEDYEKAEEEAQKRDHRKLGKELGLFVFSETVGKGLPLWTEKGATIRRELERFIVDEEIKRDYKHVYTPDIAHINLYKKSGHYPYYKDSMYPPIVIDNEEFMLRPMTCPHHFELYASEPRSYRDLPMRIAEISKLYRYEQSGELSGLIRVRSFCLADAHIICKDVDQAKSEVNKVLELIEHIASIFKLEMGKEYWYRLSLGDRNDDKKYHKDDSAWDEAEKNLREVLKERKAHFVEAPQEAAFYGPKIDIQMKDVRGKENTAFTVQYDLVMSKRFNLTYTDSDGKEKETIVIHRSSIGAIERIIAFLIEHFAGNFPLWLSPIQCAVVSVRENHKDEAERVGKVLKEASIRTSIDSGDQGLGKKIRGLKVEKTPYWIVVGDNEVNSKKFTLESRDGKKQEGFSIEEIREKLETEIQSKT